MAIGVSGGSDQGAPLEVQFQSVTEVGRHVLKTAKERSELIVVTEGPNIPFLDPSMFSQEYVSGLDPKGKITKKALENARASSIGLSLEASLQVLESRSIKKQFVESTTSLADISGMLGRSKSLVEDETRKGAVLLKVARDVAKKRGIELSDDKAAETWANEIVAKAKQRIDKKIVAIESL